MDIKTILGAIPVLLAIPSYGLYIKSTYSGKTKPHMYSWLIWSILAGVGFVGQLSDNAGPGAWNTGITVIGCFSIFLVSVRKGEKSLSSADELLLSAALIAVLVLIIANNHYVSTIMAISAALIGFALTFKKAYQYPEEETPVTFTINAIRNLISLFALSSLTFLTFAYPFAMMLANISLFSVIAIRRRTIITNLGND